MYANTDISVVGQYRPTDILVGLWSSGLFCFRNTINLKAMGTFNDLFSQFHTNDCIILMNLTIHFLTDPVVSSIKCQRCLFTSTKF